MADAAYPGYVEPRGILGLTRTEFYTLLVPIGFILLLLRFLAWVMPPPHQRRSIIVLGSGGHTSEMFRFMSTIIDDIPAHISPRHYILAATDKGALFQPRLSSFLRSEGKLMEFENKVGAKLGREFFIHRIPRAREVGRSFFTSIFTTLWAFAWSFVLACYLKAELVLANGPGTCVPVVAAAWILKKIGVTNHCVIAYSESYACVSKPSLTTRLIADHCDLFFVQWPILYKRYKNSIYSGRVPIEMRPRVRSIKGSQNQTKSYVFVSVGTTQFQELIDEVCTKEFIAVLKSLGYSGIHVQYGTGKKPAIESLATKDFEIEVFDLKPSLELEFLNASLVIGHAGVGTIFEALEKEKNVLAVPNESLMNNHQTEIANIMEKAGFIHVSKIGFIAEKLKVADFSRMRLFPKTESPNWGISLLRAMKNQMRFLPRK